MARRSLWRRLRRATRDPRNAALARAIGGFSRALGALPMPAALAVGRGLGTAAHALLATPRRLAVTHMGLAFPELDLATRRRLVRATFRHAGQAFAELSLFETILRRPDYIRLEGVEALDTALARGRGAIAVTGHVGNWELLAAWAAAIGYPITVVVRRVTDLRFHSLIIRFRAAAGVEILVRDDPRFIAGVTEALRRNRIVAMLIDQDTRGAGVFVPFFGRPAHTPPGAAVLALRARARGAREGFPARGRTAHPELPPREARARSHGVGDHGARGALFRAGQPDRGPRAADDVLLEGRRPRHARLGRGGPPHARRPRA